MITIPSDYTISKFFEYSGYPQKTNTGYKASCPICREGKSWGKKKRLFYLTQDDYLYCFNCSKSWTPYLWIKEVSGKSFLDIKNELLEGYNYSDVFLERISLDNESQLIYTEALPRDSINLFDKIQLQFYKDSYFVKKAVSFIVKRGLTKTNLRPKAFYISLNDNIHKNRLIIPFYNHDNNIEFYQSRALTPNQEQRAKFLSKANSEKYIFNLHKVDYKMDYVFLMEGAIDACFLQNALAISGVYFTDHQSDLFNKNCSFMKKIWVFDNPKMDDTGRERMIETAMNNSNDLFFIWSDMFENHKDLNDFCVSNKIWSIEPDEIIKRSFKGSKAIMKI